MSIKNKTKEELINMIIDDIYKNEVESKELLYDLARQGLEAMTKKDILSTYFADYE